MATIDDDKRNTILELKSKFDANASKLKQLESQKRQNELTLRRAAFTAAYLNEMPDTLRTYRPVGKAYFLEPKGEAMAHLEELVKTTDAELKSANAARESLTKVQEGLARELNELFDSLQKT